MTELHNLIIKGKPQTDLEKGLLAYKKEQLLQIAVQQQLSVRKSYTKMKIVEQLKPVIVKQAVDFFAQLDGHKKEKLIDLAKGSATVVSNETVMQFQSSIESGYVFAYLANGTVTLILPNELVSSIKQDTKSVINYPQAETQPLFLRQMKNAQKIYGTYDINHLVSVWNSYFAQTMTIEEATQLIETVQ
ncbi:hypothetical protein [Carnobacterium inhibens]|uniref:hypothetical protein n=1 Tax=Carnobacterium inhibens TaxID=147709 RepID=UPI00203B2C1E|nr:hypothetical protein [Carnobacterium inhibens]MCM3511457.1 hypothetical protein [Carnobacterium inhibens]